MPIRTVLTAATGKIPVAAVVAATNTSGATAGYLCHCSGEYPVGPTGSCRMCMNKRRFREVNKNPLGRELLASWSVRKEPRLGPGHHHDRAGHCGSSSRTTIGDQPWPT